MGHIQYPYKLADVAWLMSTYSSLKDPKAKTTLMTIYRQQSQAFIDEALRVYTPKERDSYPEHYLRFVVLASYFSAVPLEHLLMMVNLWGRLHDDRLVTDMVNYNIGLRQVIEAEAELNPDGGGVQYEYSLKVLIVRQVINSVIEREERHSMSDAKTTSPVPQDLIDEIVNFLSDRSSLSDSMGRHAFMTGLWGHPVLKEIDYSGSPYAFVINMVKTVLNYDHSNPAAGIDLLIQLLQYAHGQTGPENQKVIDGYTGRLKAIAKR